MKQGRGGGLRRRAVLLATLALACSLTASAFAPAAGAGSADGATRSEVQGSGTPRAQLMVRRQRRKAKRHKRRVVHRAKMTPARRKAVLATYIKGHPGILAGRLKARGGAVTAQQPTAAGTHPKAPAKHKKKIKKHKKTKAKAKVKRKANGAKVAAAGKKKKKKHAGSTWTLGHAAMSLGFLGLAGAGVFLIGSSLRPRKRRPARPVRAPKATA